MILISSSCRDFATWNRSSCNFLCKGFLYEGVEAEIFIRGSRNLEEAHVKILDHGLQYFRRYDMWKLGFFQALKFHLNMQFWNFRCNFFSTKVQKLKFLEREEEILRNALEKIQILVRNIFGDMICGIRAFLGSWI